MGGKKKYIEMFGSFTKPFNCKHLYDTIAPVFDHFTVRQKTHLSGSSVQRQLRTTQVSQGSVLAEFSNDEPLESDSIIG